MGRILIVAEHRNGELRAVSAELVGVAAALKQQNGWTTQLVIIGAGAAAFPSAFAFAGLDEITLVRTAEAEFDPDIYEQVVQSLIEKQQPTIVLVPHSVNAMAFAPALAARHDHGFASDVFGLEIQEGVIVATRAGYGQKVNVELEFPGKSVVIVTYRPGAAKAPEGSAKPVVDEIAWTSHQPLPSRHLGYVEPPATGDVDIATAKIMLSIGRGVGEEANVEQFRELAESLGATLGCSRPIADSGWLPKSRQVGQSGKIVANCKLYVAMGISGSVQHMAGMKHVETIIAVNADPEASIFTIATYGIVGDMFEIGEELKALAG